MMRADHPLLASREERATYFAAAGAALGYAPAVVEKDFWVCVVLAALRASEGDLRWVFKGGTSLSKAYGVIDRFSEDIDLVLSRDGFPAAQDPHAEGVGSKERRRRLEKLEAWAHERLREQVIPELRTVLRSWLPAGDWSLDAAEEGEDEQWLFHYPAGDGDEGYIPRYVKLEFGCRGALTPSETRRLRAMVAEGTDDATVDFQVDVPVLALERTFFEKATAVHAFWHQAHPEAGGAPKALRPRLARHWYDLHRMWSSDEYRASILASLHLLDDVIEHKETWYTTKAARYDLAKHEIHLIPDGELEMPAARDYEAMASMFPASPGRPAWEEIVASCANAQHVLRDHAARRRQG